MIKEFICFCLVVHLLAAFFHACRFIRKKLFDDTTPHIQTDREIYYGMNTFAFFITPPSNLVPSSGRSGERENIFEYRLFKPK